MFLALALALGSACASDADDGDETTPPDSVAAPTETLEAPARLRSSRGDALTPARIELRAYLEGPTALTELHLDFVNDAAHPLEGTLELELPDDAAVVRVSFELAGVSREGELVSRAADDVLDLSRRAAPDVGREPTRRVAAPTRASFQTRVPRIPARARARVLVAYAQAFDDPAAPYVTPLRELDAVPWSHEITIAGPGASPITLREDGIPPARIERSDDASVALARDELLLTRVRVPEELDRGPAALDGLTIALDTSASQAAQLAASVARVVSLVEALASETGRDLPVQLIAFDQSAELVFEGPARALAGAAPRLLERDGLGATSLASLIAALADVSARPRLLLVTDARDTVGGPHLPALR
ncbi:MAG: hypothetical protein KC468_35275, partial [Myxococcales bacterium]|nr:hypothetical protein [Myxococcales bacterium]